MRITKDIPDRYWFGEKPQLIKEHRGEKVDKLIEQLKRQQTFILGKTHTGLSQVQTVTPLLHGSLRMFQSLN